MIPAPVGPRLPAARHARPRRVYRGRRIAAWAALAGTGAVALGGWLLYARLDGCLATAGVDAALGSDPRARGCDGAFSILLLGPESGAGRNMECQDDGGARSGTAMLVHLVQGWEGAAVVTIPGETMVIRPGCLCPAARPRRPLRGRRSTRLTQWVAWPVPSGRSNGSAK